jgi:hypothetical protein
MYNTYVYQQNQRTWYIHTNTTGRSLPPPQLPYHHKPTLPAIFLHYAVNHNHHLHSQSTPLPPKRCGKRESPPTFPAFLQRSIPRDPYPEIHTSARTQPTRHNDIHKYQMSADNRYRIRPHLNTSFNYLFTGGRIGNIISSIPNQRNRRHRCAKAHAYKTTLGGGPPRLAETYRMICILEKTGLEEKEERKQPLCCGKLSIIIIDNSESRAVTVEILIARDSSAQLPPPFTLGVFWTWNFVFFSGLQSARL